MLEDSFNIRKAWDVDPPCYVRKIDRKGHWTDTERILNKALPTDNGRISVFLVNSAMDVARVAVALNANRSKLDSDLHLVAIRLAELDDKIVVEATPGETRCGWANHLHRDLVVSDSTSLTRSVEAMLGAARRPYTFKGKTEMKLAVASIREQGCVALVANSVRCRCEDELPPHHQPSILHRFWNFTAAAVRRIHTWIRSLIRPN